MKITLVKQVSGTRNGAPWPAPGNTIDVPEAEAAGLVSLGIAEGQIAPEPVAETRTAAPTKTATKAPRKGKS